MHTVSWNSCVAYQIVNDTSTDTNLHINWSKNRDKTPKTRQNHYHLLRRCSVQFSHFYAVWKFLPEHKFFFLLHFVSSSASIQIERCGCVIFHSQHLNASQKPLLQIQLITPIILPSPPPTSFSCCCCLYCPSATNHFIYNFPFPLVAGESKSSFLNRCENVNFLQQCQFELNRFGGFCSCCFLHIFVFFFSLGLYCSNRR